MLGCVVCVCVCVCVGSTSGSSEAASLCFVLHPHLYPFYLFNKYLHFRHFSCTHPFLVAVPHNHTTIVFPRPEGFPVCPTDPLGCCCQPISGHSAASCVTEITGGWTCTAALTADKLFPDIQREPPAFQFVIIASDPATRHHWAPSPLHPPFKTVYVS